MKKLLVVICLFLSFLSSAQDNLLNMLKDDDHPIQISYLFKGTKVVNGQSVETPAKGVLQFNIQHRFGPINSGSYNLYGLDFSQVRLSLDYGINNWISAGIARSSSLKTIDASSKIIFKHQVRNGFPVKIVSHSAVYFKQHPGNLPAIFTNQLSFSNQMLIARKISRNLTIQLSPTLVHYNLVENVAPSIKHESNDKYSIGFSGRYKVTKRVSLNSEYFYQLNNKLNNNVLSLGFDIETGGHIFQLHLSNSPAMIDPEFITQTIGSWFNGDIYFGFNISRVFTLNK